ncbi:MAG: hypothetical protein IJT21_08715 [Synergistaceae bacterium]|nr:hypothetical protein [Synergistaceae bacterium]
MRKILLALVILCVSVSAASSEEVYRVGVMRFLNKAPGMSYGQAEIITDIFTRMISNSRKIAVIERERLETIGREHRLSMSGLVDSNMAVQVGRLAGCQYMILGSVTQFESKHSSTGFGNLFHETTYTAEVTIDMRIINVTTGEVVLSMAETGTANDKSTSVSFQGITTNEGTGISAIESKAVEDAVTKLGVRVRETVADEYMQVLAAGGRDVTLSVGATSGGRKGALYRVYSEGDSVLDMDGNVIGRKTQTIAVVQIIDVQTSFSMARGVKEGGDTSLIRRGDKIAPISASEARELAKRKEFPRSRPRAALGSDIEGLDAALRTSPSPADDYTPAPAPKPAPVNTANFENKSTDPAKVIASYGLPSGQANTLRVAHINARRLRGANAYRKYVELANSNSSDYLAAYKAGETAFSMGKRPEARQWFETALRINPNYEPAKNALNRMDATNRPRNSRRRK